MNDPIFKPTPSPYYTAEHKAFRDSVRAFVEREVEPFVDEWDEAGEFPRDLYHRAGEAGLLAVGFPEEYGGIPADAFMKIILNEELARAGSGGIIAGLLIHGIGAPPIVAMGCPELKQRVLPGILAGDKICALAVTEPSGGSDVANLRTKAKREGDHYVVNGSKMFITSGMRADYYTVAVRTGGEGMQGISLLLVEKGTPGFSQTPLKKMGWWCSDTAALYFDDCRVPAENLVGEENSGFYGIMNNFNSERFGLAGMSIGFAQVCLEESVAWARQRETFGKRLADHQVIRHKIVDMAGRINAARAFLENLAWRVGQGEKPVAELCMLKNIATSCVEYCAGEAVQILGGAGFIRGNKVERIYRETKVLAIGGGSTEIMKDLAARQMGL